MRLEGSRGGAGTLDQDGTREGVLDLLHKRESLLAESVLVNETSLAQNIGSQILHGVDLDATAGERKTLHVPPLGTAQADDA